MAFFAFGRGLCSSLRLFSWLGVLKARCTAYAPAANATVTSHIRQRRAWCAQALEIAQCFGAAGCRLLLQSPAAASRRISTRRVLELQLFAAVDSCRSRLRMLCGSMIALLPLFTMLHGQQQELLRVVDSVREADERAFQRGQSGCDRRRLWRAVRAGGRPCVILQCRLSRASACMHACVHAI